MRKLLEQAAEYLGEPPHLGVVILKLFYKLIQVFFLWLALKIIWNPEMATIFATAAAIGLLAGDIVSWLYWLHCWRRRNLPSTGK